MPLLPSSLTNHSYGWAQTSSLYLPLPAAVPATNVFLPIASSILLSLSVVLSRHRIRAIAALPTVLAYILTVVPIILLTISLAYCIPSSALACLTDTRWDRLFRSKNEGAISSIQGQLRCCGLNSMRDRAWPFERHGVSVRECEESQGWTRRCLDVWTSSEQQTAGLAVAASVLNWIFIVSSRFLQVLANITNKKSAEKIWQRYLSPSLCDASTERLPQHCR